MPKRSPTRLPASPDAVRSAAIASLGATADGDSVLLVPAAPGAQPAIDLTLRVRADRTRSSAAIHPDGGVGIPVFGWFFIPLVAIARRRSRTHALACIQAALEGRTPPPPPGNVIGLPPVPFAPDQATLLATAGAATAVTSFA